MPETQPADGRVRVARRLGPRATLRAALRRTRSSRRQFALVSDVSGHGVPPIPEGGEFGPIDSLAFKGFTELVPTAKSADLLELLWYVRFAAEGHGQLLATRDAEGRPTFSTWMLDATGQRQAADRFWDGFHKLTAEEMLLEGIFTFPAARGRGVARVGIQAACGWAAAQGVRRVWVYPYMDKPWALPLFAGADFRPDHARVEVISLGRARGHTEPLSRSELVLWETSTKLPIDPPASRLSTYGTG